ncbi:hypothetical protein Tco_1441422, partial [Tanacetum coccineum]
VSNGQHRHQCLRKVVDEYFTVAVKVLFSSGVAPYCDDTIKSLEAKHPYKLPPSMPSITFSEHPLIAEIDSVFGCIKLFSKGTSCGRDGLRAQHILDALCGEGSATATDLLKGELSSIHCGGLYKWADNEIVCKIKDSCKLLLHAWYLDDRTVIGDSEEVVIVLDIKRWLLVSLPIRFGGLGLYSSKVVSSYAFVASRAQSWVLQDHILRESTICGMDEDLCLCSGCLRDTILSFDFSSFTNKDIAPFKSQQTLASALFSEVIKDMEVL